MPAGQAHHSGRSATHNNRSKRFVHRILQSLPLTHLAFALPTLITLLLLHALRSPSNPLQLPLFDTSSTLIDTSGEDTSTLRWDVIHFQAIAKQGYAHEQQTAFQPGLPLILRFLAGLEQWVQAHVFGGGDVPSQNGLPYGAAVLAIVGSGLRTAMLFKLTSLLISRRFAISSICLYILAPTPAVLASPYTEPLFALATFSGLYQAVQRRYLPASMLLACATSLRATGVFAAPLLVGIALSHRKSWTPKMVFATGVRLAIPCLIIIAPFLTFQYYTYRSFCTPVPTRPWCSRSLPFSYSFVQAEYWNVGFLKYWTIAQLPNLLIASPVLGISILGIFRLLTGRSHLPRTLLPFGLHHALMTFLMIFSSHTQIALRVISTDPTFWWLLAEVAFKGSRITRLGKVWIGWAVVWGAVSIVLWAGHYPPA